MSVSDKKRIISENNNIIAGNVPKVYEAGFNAGQNSGGQGSFDEGLWDTLQTNGVYNNAFAGVTWNKERFKPKYKIVPNATLNSAREMFNYFNYDGEIDTNAKEITYDMIDLSNCTQASQVSDMFNNATMNYIEIDLSPVSDLRNIFICNNGGKIYNIRAKINATKFTNILNNCTQLKTFILEEGSVIGGNGFNAQWSTKLSKESIESIIAALSDSTTGLSITLSKTAVNNAFSINVDNPTTYPEGSEYYTLRNSKPNWTFNYA